MSTDPDEIARITGLGFGGTDGYVIPCNPDTMNACFHYGIMGSTSKALSTMTREIRANTKLFLFNYVGKQLYGPFVPASAPRSVPRNARKAADMVHLQANRYPSQLDFAEGSGVGTKTLSLLAANPHKIELATNVLDEEQFAWVMENLVDVARDPFETADEWAEKEVEEAQGKAEKKKRPRYNEDALLHGTLDGDTGNGGIGLTSEKWRDWGEAWAPHEGRGHEAADLNKLMGMYKRWAWDMHKGLNFNDFLTRTDKLMGSRAVQDYMVEQREHLTMGRGLQRGGNAANAAADGDGGEARRRVPRGLAPAAADGLERGGDEGSAASSSGGGGGSTAAAGGEAATVVESAEQRKAREAAEEAAMEEAMAEQAAAAEAAMAMEAKAAQREQDLEDEFDEVEW
jgi:hypothetical protein